MSEEQKEAEQPSVREFYTIRFRENGQQFSAVSEKGRFKPGDVVMVQMDHGLEPALVKNGSPACRDCKVERKASYEIGRSASMDEKERFSRLSEMEQKACQICGRLIKKHQLEMSLVRVEKFFNGSKIIFYFTAENRVDFRGLVKDLVQKFRTRIEMRQVGVRHETKMIGGLGSCGRELCCSSYMKRFDSVSIKMAKEQDLPLNPAKISGVCNRLLCCLTYEYETYKKLRKRLPRIDRKIRLDNTVYRVKRQNPLDESIVVISIEGEELLLSREEWKKFEILKPDRPSKGGGKRQH